MTLPPTSFTPPSPHPKNQTPPRDKTKQPQKLAFWFCYLCWGAGGRRDPGHVRGLPPFRSVPTAPRRPPPTRSSPSYGPVVLLHCLRPAPTPGHGRFRKCLFAVVLSGSAPSSRRKRERALERGPTLCLLSPAAAGLPGSCVKAPHICEQLAVRIPRCLHSHASPQRARGVTQSA